MTHDYDSGSLDSKVYNPFIHLVNKCSVVAVFFFFFFFECKSYMPSLVLDAGDIPVNKMKPCCL